MADNGLRSIVVQYLSKQTAALKEVNESRLKVYEQLEVSLQEVSFKGIFVYKKKHNLNCIIVKNT